MLDSGPYMLPGLPNGTKNTQEMDWVYSEFKLATDMSTVCIAAMKMAKQVEAQKLIKRRKTIEVGEQNNAPAIPTLGEDIVLKNCNNFWRNMEMIMMKVTKKAGDADGDVCQDNDFSFEVEGQSKVLINL